MASVFTLRRNNLKETAADAAKLLMIWGLIFGVAGALAVLWMTSSLRNFGTAAGLVVVFIGAFVSGNPRLYCLWGFMLTIPLNLSKRFGPMFVGKAGGEDSFRVEISDLFLVALLGFLIWEILIGRRRGLRVPKVTFLWVLLIAIGCVWIIIGPWRTTAAHEVVRMSKVLVLFLVIVNELDRPGRIWHCTAALALGVVMESSIGLVQYFMKGLIGLEILGETTSATITVLGTTSVEGESVFRPSALLQHANLLGMFVAVLIPMAIGMFMVSRRTVPRILFLAAIGLGPPAVVVALSRSAWLSLAVGVSLLLFFTVLHPGLRWRSLAASSLTGLLAAGVLVALFGPIMQRLLRSKDNSTVAREIYKADARRMISAAPWFGRGLNSYAFELPNFSTLSINSYGEKPPAVHHIFYLWWAETGIVGMLLFSAVWGCIIWVGIQNLGVRDEFLFVVNAACLAGMISLIPDAFLSFTLRVNTLLRVFWLLAGMIMAVRYLRLQERAGVSLQARPLEPAPNE